MSAREKELEAEIARMGAEVEIAHEDERRVRDLLAEKRKAAKGRNHAVYEALDAVMVMSLPDRPHHDRMREKLKLPASDTPAIPQPAPDVQAALADALAAALPYAESRAEDLSEQLEAAVEEGCGAGEIQQAAQARDKAWAAVEGARAAPLLAGRRS